MRWALRLTYDRDSQVQKAAKVSRSLAADPGLRITQGDEVFCPRRRRHWRWALSRKRWGAIATKRCEHSSSSFEPPKSRWRHGPVNNIEELQNCLAYRRKSLRANVRSGRHFAPEDSSGGGENTE